MIFWRHYLILFGGFHDTSSITKYHNDLWVFDAVEEKWKEIKTVGGRSPEPRSGFSFLPSAEGAVVVGGYAKLKGPTGKLRGVIYNGIIPPVLGDSGISLINRYLESQNVHRTHADKMGEKTQSILCSIVSFIDMDMDELKLDLDVEFQWHPIRAEEFFLAAYSIKRKVRKIYLVYFTKICISLVLATKINVDTHIKSGVIDTLN